MAELAQWEKKVKKQLREQEKHEELKPLSDYRIKRLAEEIELDV